MQYDLLGIDFAPVVGVVFLLIFLMVSSELNVDIKRMFYVLIALQLVEMISFNCELIYGGMPTFHIARKFWAAIGYTVRPILLFLILKISIRNEEKEKIYSRIFGGLLIGNAILAFSSFFTNISFSYTASNQFVRGPLGFTPHIVVVVFQVFLVVYNLKNSIKHHKFESVIVLGIVSIVFLSLVVETTEYSLGVGRTAIALSIIFYYMYFQSQFYRENMNDEFTLRKKLEYQNSLDGLTSLLNKQCFELESKAILQEEGRSSVALIFVDLDHFKEINDKLGHIMGDQVLIEVSQIIRGMFRKGDLVARFGGDEFCVLVKDVPFQTLERQLESLIQSLKLQYKNQEECIEISASIGAVYCQKVCKTKYEDLLEQADTLLYQAKNKGKNRYIVKEVFEVEEINQKEDMQEVK